MSNYRNQQTRFFKLFKRKLYISNEVKKALLIAFVEAKSYQTYVNLDLLLYGLISQPNSLASRLFSLTISQFRNNKNITSKLVSEKIKKLNSNNFKIKSNELSSELLLENKQTPCLTPDVKEILRSSINAALLNKKKITVVTTKHLLFDLLSRESLRDSLRNLVN